jgi:protocatechuate 3,4-dioxygenase beta subunit
MLPKILTVWILTAAALAAQLVEGRVVNTATGNGVPDVSVGLLAMGQTAYRATTDAAGRFRIEAVQDGWYTPYYKSANFRPAHDGAAPAFRVTAGPAPVHLEYEMVPIARLSGRVLDGAGNPVPKASLQLMQVSGSSTIVMTVTANDKGEYASPESMPAGAWTLSAIAPPAWKPPEPREGQILGWAQTFYPSVTDSGLAVKVDVPPGSQVADLDIKLAAAPVYRIRGVLFDVHGDPVPKASVELGVAGMGGLPISSGPRQDTDADGAFEFESVVDGEFRLSSTVNRDGVKQRASETVQVKGHDLENVKFQLTLPFSIEEKIAWKFPKAPLDLSCQ